ncbi:MAG: DUF2160 domain-containing protein [Pseudomonadota bacterium]
MEWMAWTWPTALFFVAIGATLVCMTILQIRFPSVARMGALGIETTRGDRLFISLLGSAFINLAWVGLLDAPQYGALAICVVFAACVFRWV